MPAALQMALDLLEARSLVPLAFVLLMIALVLRRRPKARTYAMATQAPQRESKTPDAQQQQLRQELESLVVELDELARKINAQIDTRFAKLETVIRDADRRIAVLEQLTRQAQETAGHQRSQGPPGNAQHRVVYEMADAGKNPIEIARELGRSPGEVELILNLRSQPTPSAKVASAPKKRRSKRNKSP